MLRAGGEADWLPGRALGDAVRVEQSDGLMRVRGTARMLHVTRSDGHGR
jgi:hypothetical protein